MPDTAPHPGQCLCGAVTFTVAAEPVGARQCWCRDCQRIASGSATANVLFPRDAVRYTGPITEYEKVADSGNRVARGFCAQCGSQMYSRIKEPAAPLIRVRAGTLDDPGAFPPQAIIWAASAPAWAVLDPAIPHFPKAPPASSAVK